MATEWYCRRSATGGVYGPFTMADLRRLVDLGKLQPTHQVRAGQVGSWETAREALPQLFGMDAEPSRRKSRRSSEPAEAEVVDYEPPTAEVLDFEPPPDERPTRRVTEKYPALRFIATIYGVLAIGGFVLYAIAAIFVSFSGLLSGAKDRDGVPVIGGLIAAFLCLLVGAFVAITLYATKEAIMLMIDIEHCLRQIRNQLSKRD